MKFSEKLQKLRKENKLSQEQLADMLEVSRQAVSKWESGTTYPEMDKLLALCKIFKCSLDELTNDDITEFKSPEKGKLTAGNLVDEIMDIINKSIEMFQKMSSADITKCILIMLGVIIGLSFLNIPVEYINDLGRDIFMGFGSQVGNILCPIWNFILSVSYLIFAIICFFYIYKSQFLEKWEKKENPKGKEMSSESTIELDPVSKENQTTENNQTETSKSVVKDIVYVPPREHQSSTILKVLGQIVSFFAKFCLACMGIPFLCTFLILITILVIGIVLVFQGITYIGIFLLLISAILFNYMIIELLFNVIASRKNHPKKIFILFMIALLGTGIGAGVTAIEFSNTEYYDQLPATYQSKTVKQEYPMTDKFVITNDYYYDSITYTIDESLTEQVIVEVKYYDQFHQIEFYNLNDQEITIEHHHEWPQNYSEFKKIVLDYLKEKKIYNYSLLENIEINVKSSQVNINQIKTNQTQLEQKRKEYHQQSEREEYSRQLQEYQHQIDQDQQKISDLEDDKRQVEQELEEYKNKLEEYKNRLNDLLHE